LASCGDSHTQAGVEDCDDGNQVQTDSCLNDCSAASCGDSHIQEGVEACDDGNMEQTDACLNNCSTASCGDGFVRQDLQEDQPGFEACDDANNNDGDTCNNNCRLGRDGSSRLRAAASCLSLKRSYPNLPSASYWLDPTVGDAADAFQAYCDMETEGGGWMLVASVTNRWAKRSNPRSGFFTQHLRQTETVWVVEQSNPVTSLLSRGVMKVDELSTPSVIRYQMIDTANNNMLVNQMTFSDVNSIVHLQQFATLRHQRTGRAQASTLRPAEEQRTVYLADDPAGIWGYDTIFGRCIDRGNSGWQFGLSVNHPDNRCGYDGVHDDAGRAEYNLGVAGNVAWDGDVAGYWPGFCEQGCANEDWSSRTIQSGRALVRVWYR
jgi:cysteine-rich repeat protein